MLLEEICVCWRTIIPQFRKDYKLTKIRHLAIHLFGKRVWKWLMAPSPAQTRGSASTEISSVVCKSRWNPQCCLGSQWTNSRLSTLAGTANWYKLNLLNWIKCMRLLLELIWGLSEYLKKGKYDLHLRVGGKTRFKGKYLLKKKKIF